MIRFTSEDYNQKRKQIEITIVEEGNIQVIRSGLGDQGKKRKTTVTAGDIVEVIIRKELGERFDLNGNIHRADWWKKKKRKGAKFFYKEIMFTDPGRGSYIGFKDFTLKFKVKKPKINITTNQPIFIGDYHGDHGFGNTKDTWGARWYIEESAKNGYFRGRRLIPLGAVWDGGNFECVNANFMGFKMPFLKNAQGKYDITKFDPDWEAQWKADCWRMRQLGMTANIDVFDQIGLKQGDYNRQQVHPFNSNNNIHGEIRLGFDFNGATEFHRGRDFIMKTNYAAISEAKTYDGNRTWGSGAEAFGRILKAYARNLQSITPKGDDFIFCTSCEPDNIGFEDAVISWLDHKRNPLCINGSWLWGLYDRRGRLYDITDATLQRRSRMFNRIRFIRVHQMHSRMISTDDGPRDLIYIIAARCAKIIKWYPHIKIISDDDGVGTKGERGTSRGFQTIPEYKIDIELCKLYFRNSFAGYVVKALNEEDGKMLMKEFKL